MHLPHHQALLRNAALHGGVDAVIERIRKENPAAFHTEPTNDDSVETLSTRVFFNQPMRGEPAKGFVRFYDPLKAAA